jgi:hypothetical protein
MLFPPWGRLRRHADGLLAERNQLAAELASARRELDILQVGQTARDERIQTLEAEQEQRCALVESLPVYLARTDLQRALAMADRLRASRGPVAGAEPEDG